MNFPEEQFDDTLMTSAQVRESLGGVSHMWVVRRLADDPDFPKPIYIRDRRYWQRGHIAAYKRAKAGSSSSRGRYGVAREAVA